MTQENLSENEVEKRRDDALRRALNTPPLRESMKAQNIPESPLGKGPVAGKSEGIKPGGKR